MARKGTGVELREKSIRVNFTLGGEWIRETLPWAPTPANEKKAIMMVAAIKKEIAAGSFVYETHFPGSKRAPRSLDGQTFGEACDLWLGTKGRLATKSLNQYRNALEVWKGMFGADTAMGKLTHAQVAYKVGVHPWASAKLLNNYLICLRGVFTLAGRGLKVENPMDGVENSKHQAAPPDPLSSAEMEQVLKRMESAVPQVVLHYFEFAFMTGMRPEELIALRWTDVDWANESIRVERARTAGEYKPLKTYQARDVDLVKRALLALKEIGPLTHEQAGGYIFMNPVTNKPWHDERSQRDHYWKPVLKDRGIRYRRAYQTRHTYATNALSAGVNPSYVSRQMGHKSAKMLFAVYSKWIDGADRGREKAKMEAMLNGSQAASQ